LTDLRKVLYSALLVLATSGHIEQIAHIRWWLSLTLTHPVLFFLLPRKYSLRERDLYNPVEADTKREVIGCRRLGSHLQWRAWGNVRFRPRSAEGCQIISVFVHQKTGSPQAARRVYPISSTASLHVRIAINGADPSGRAV
jgi:hypothetical protein